MGDRARITWTRFNYIYNAEVLDGLEEEEVLLDEVLLHESKSDCTSVYESKSSSSNIVK